MKQSTAPHKADQNRLVQFLIITALFFNLALPYRVRRSLSHLFVATIYCMLMSMYSRDQVVGWALVILFTPAVRNSLEYLQQQQQTRAVKITRALINFGVWAPVAVNSLAVVLIALGYKLNLAVQLHDIAQLALYTAVPVYIVYRICAGIQHINWPDVTNIE